MARKVSGSTTMHDVILRGGSVLTTHGISETDVAVADGKVVAMGESLGEAIRTIECTDAWVGPGFVDIHTHLREPGQEWKESIATGSAAAAAGGYTAMVAMPTSWRMRSENGVWNWRP